MKRPPTESRSPLQGQGGTRGLRAIEPSRSSRSSMMSIRTRLCSGRRNCRKAPWTCSSRRPSARRRTRRQGIATPRLASWPCENEFLAGALGRIPDASAKR